MRYLKLSGRPAAQIQLVEDYARAQGLWRLNGAAPAQYTDVLELDLGTVEPSLAGPSRPQDRVPLRIAKSVYEKHHARMAEERARKNRSAGGRAAVSVDGQSFELRDGAVLIAAITSCTNTSNPYVLMAAGLLARNAHRARAQVQALGQDQPGAGLARGHRLSAEGIVARPAGRHRLRPGRLWLHHLHRQLRATQARDLGRRQSRRPHRLRGAVGQPQFRRPRAPGSEDEFPGLAATGGRLCAGRLDGPGPQQRAARPRQRRQGRSSSRTSGLVRRKSPTRYSATSTRTCSSAATAACSRATSAGRPSPCRPARSTPGMANPPTSRTRPTSKA